MPDSFFTLRGFLSSLNVFTQWTFVQPTRDKELQRPPPLFLEGEVLLETIQVIFALPRPDSVAFEVSLSASLNSPKLQHKRLRFPERSFLSWHIVNH